MRPHRGLFGWKVTRALFGLGVFFVVSGLINVFVVVHTTWGAYALLSVVGLGLGLVALSSRGPWDSEASGRNRSVLGFRARP